MIEDGIVDIKPGFYIYNSAGTPILSAPLSGGLTIVGDGTFSGDISGASGTFSGNLSASSGLFSVSNGVLTAQSGTIGGWTINSTQLRSSGTNYISLNPITPKIALVQSGVEKITLDPVEGIKDSAGNFTLTPAGNLTIKGSITAGSTITGSDITITGNKSGTGSVSSLTSKLTFSASNYAVAAGSSSWTYTTSDGYWDSTTGEWVASGTSITTNTNDVRFTDATYGGSVPYGSSFYYGEMWLGSGNSSGTVDLWANHPSGYIGISLVANDTQKNIYIYGSGSGFGSVHSGSNGSDTPAVLQAGSDGKISRGRAFLSGGATASYLNANGVGLNGDLYFSTQ